ncbi:sulfur carrier protein ThiS adenylyltransferase ThiF [Clostridium sp. HCP1S3_B4]|uniref:sulfur carrier protein ThiS adenylyltransferase ThiF n=1 Tax=unclassified Clostridium TaxID=2614128 RepID=UPI003F88A766
MKILVNEIEKNTEETSAFSLKNIYKKDADIIIVNGFPIKEDMILKDGDKITFIKRGEIPKKEELEALMSSRHTPKVHEKLKKGRIAIAGAGGLGSNVAISLARIGVGYIKVIDFDIVEPSNLNRQQYFINQIGMKKVDALKDNIKEINPFIDFEAIDTLITEDNIKELFDNVDIVIEAFDNPKYKAILVNGILSCFKDTIIISGSGMAGYYSNNLIQTKKINSRLYICGDMTHEAKIGEGLMAPRVCICANHEANMAVRLLLNELDA